MSIELTQEQLDEIEHELTEACETAIKEGRRLGSVWGCYPYEMLWQWDRSNLDNRCCPIGAYLVCNQITTEEGFAGRQVDAAQMLKVSSEFVHGFIDGFDAFPFEIRNRMSNRQGYELGLKFRQKYISDINS